MANTCSSRASPAEKTPVQSFSVDNRVRAQLFVIGNSRELDSSLCAPFSEAVEVKGLEDVTRL